MNDINLNFLVEMSVIETFTNDATKNVSKF